MEGALPWVFGVAIHRCNWTTAVKGRNLPVRVVVGVLVLALAVIGSALLFMQPWVSCTVDDVSAGCPVPEDLVTITSIGWAAVALAAVTGIVLLARCLRAAMHHN